MEGNSTQAEVLFKRFMEDNAPDKQLEVCGDLHTSFFGEAPTMVKVDALYGKGSAVIWLIPQLFDLSEYCGCKDKLKGFSLEQCARVIRQEYGYLTIAELMLFFFRFKTGRYGKFYGSVDPLVILTAIRDFLGERLYMHTRHEQEETERKQMEHAKRCISWEEYCKLNKIKDRESPLIRML